MSSKALILMVIAGLALSACGSYQAFDYVDQNESMKGPGAFTGEDGEWVIYRKK
ncbi:MAG: hypothetical protein QGI63_10065 [Rhodospirillales bacterium]|nr:hypothetical protein [Rhodospirillales bacterium]MDP6774606.1 hypothetical protein [Rhodospirillales bacterium]